MKNFKKTYFLLFPILMVGCGDATSENTDGSSDQVETIDETEILEIEESTSDVDKGLKELEEHSTKATEEIDSLLNDI